MNKRITFRALLAFALLTGCVAIEAKPPTCTQPVGKWHDELKSVIEIRTYDTATGAIKGEYIGHTGVGSWPMVGWVNSAQPESNAPGKAGKGDHAIVFTLAVRWVNPDGITTWTGTCAVNTQSGPRYLARPLPLLPRTVPIKTWCSACSPPLTIKKAVFHSYVPDWPIYPSDLFF